MLHVFVDVPLDDDGLRRLTNLNGVRVTLADPILEEETDRDLSQIRQAHVAFCSYLPRNLDDMRALRWVQLASSGYSQLLGLNLPSRGVRACNARGVFDTAIAEWNVAMMVCLARHVRRMIRNQESRVWDRGAVFQTEIRGRTVGLWGYGGIARQTAWLCKALGLDVHVLSRTGVGPRRNVYVVPGTGDVEGTLPDRVFSYEMKREFLSGLDFLILCTPLTPQTEGMVGPDELGALPRTAFLLNPARGPLVQEQALLDALQDDQIAGAALDAHYHYPLPADHPLWSFEQVILTPHVSGSSESPYFRERLWDLFVQNCRRYLANEPLLNEIPSQRL